MIPTIELPLQGDIYILNILPRALPWARINMAFNQYFQDVYAA